MEWLLDATSAPLPSVPVHCTSECIFPPCDTGVPQAGVLEKAWLCDPVVSAFYSPSRLPTWVPPPYRAADLTFRLSG